jgi:hypothetical protein
MGEGLDRTHNQQGAQGECNLIILGRSSWAGGINPKINCCVYVRNLCIPPPRSVLKINFMFVIHLNLAKPITNTCNLKEP